MATITQYALPVLATLLVWWITTGVVLLVVNLRPATYPASLIAATLVLVAALIGLHWTSADATVAGAYGSFCCGILIWGWIELTYYTGMITGPRPFACPGGVTTWRRFSLALQTSLYHELTILAFAALAFALTWRMPNQVGAWTFAILWLMRWSTKLNIFLGVPHLNLQWFPGHLRYLESFIVKRPMNPLFPISIVASLGAAGLAFSAIVRGDAAPVEVATALLLGTLILLAIAEHGFLVLPLRDAALWAWALPSGEPRDTHQDSAARSPAESPSAGGTRRSNRPFTGLDSAAVFGASPPSSAPSSNGR